MTKRYKINITDHAQTDLEHIYYYIAEDNISNACTFILELEEKIYSLATFPERNPLIPENEFFKTEYRHLIYNNYRIVYRIAENRIFILRIFHGAKLLDL